MKTQQCSNPDCRKETPDSEVVLGKDGAYCSDVCKNLTEYGEHPLEKEE